MFRGIFRSSALGKQILSTCDIADALVLRKINDNIRRAYGIRQMQRTHAVKLARSALAEWTPKGVVSADLKSCFESITPKHVIEKLKLDGRVSHQTIHLLETFFRQTRTFGSNKYSKGLPRGVLISSTLAELFLKRLDEEISNTPGLYVYIRYVDDILAISAAPAQALFEKISTAISRQNLRMNLAKSEVKDSGCVCAFECQHPLGSCPCSATKCSCERGKKNFEQIDYLGYKFIFTTGKASATSPACYTLIADSKMEKFKSRVALAIADYRTNKDYDLLRDRVSLLTKNVTVDKTLKRSRLKSGIAFTYEQYCAPPTPHGFDVSTVEHLDTFLRTKLRKLCASNPSISYMQKRSLMRNSFSFGHSNRHRISFDAGRMKLIRRCWDVK